MHRTIVLLSFLTLFSACKPDTYYRTLSTASVTAGAVAEVAYDMCEPVLAGCIAAETNPCPALTSCQLARREVYRTLQTAQQALRVAVESREAGKIEDAEDALSLGLKLINEIRAILARYGVTL